MRRHEHHQRRDRRVAGAAGDRDQFLRQHVDRVASEQRQHEIRDHLGQPDQAERDHIMRERVDMPAGGDGQDLVGECDAAAIDRQPQEGRRKHGCIIAEMQS